MQVHAIGWLTAEVDENDLSRPDKPGRLRLVGCMGELTRYRQAKPAPLLFPIGAFPDMHGVTLGEKYYAYVKGEYPDTYLFHLGHRSGGRNNTVHDVVDAVPIIRRDLRMPHGWIVMVFPTYFLHYLRIVPACLSLGILPLWRTSGEQSRLPLWKDLAACLVSFIDWRWSWGPGKVLVRMADGAAEEAKQRWAEIERRQSMA